MWASFRFQFPGLKPAVNEFVKGDAITDNVDKKTSCSHLSLPQDPCAVGLRAAVSLPLWIQHVSPLRSYLFDMTVSKQETSKCG